MLVSQLVS
jgi:hypothetical protein